jgi:hypothetical protein
VISPAIVPKSVTCIPRSLEVLPLRPHKTVST